MTPAHPWWVVLQERNPELRKPKCFIMGTPAFGCGGKYCLCLPKLVTLNKDTWKGSPEQRAVSVSLIRHSEMQETCDKLPRIVALPQSCWHCSWASPGVSAVICTVGFFSQFIKLAFLFPLRKPISVYLIFWYFQISFWRLFYPAFLEIFLTQFLWLLDGFLWFSSFLWMCLFCSVIHLEDFPQISNFLWMWECI